jgi:hypothetical protein
MLWVDVDANRITDDLVQLSYEESDFLENLIGGDDNKNKYWRRVQEKETYTIPGLR